MFSIRRLTGFRGFSRKYGIVTTSSNLNPPEISPDHRGKRRRGQQILHVVITLDPNKIAEKQQQPLLINDIHGFRPHVMLHNRLVCGALSLYYARIHGKNIPFPSNIKAFLYYTTPSDKPRIGGELRLRVGSSNDFASFATGSDLLRQDGLLPWSRPLQILSKYYTPLYEKLREEGLVQDDLDAVLSTLPAKKQHYSHAQFLYSLNDTFVADFSRGLTLSIITEQGMESIRSETLFMDHRSMCKRHPYTGHALARFERSTLPKHRGTRTIVLRFLKIITPVKCLIPLYDNHIMWPTAGNLFQKSSSNKSRIFEPWSLDITKPRNPRKKLGLQLLWDA